MTATLGLVGQEVDDGARRAAEVFSHVYEVGPVEGAWDGECPTGFRWSDTVVAAHWDRGRSRRAGAEGDVDGLAHGVELEPGIGERRPSPWRTRPPPRPNLPARRRRDAAPAAIPPRARHADQQGTVAEVAHLADRYQRVHAGVLAPNDSVRLTRSQVGRRPPCGLPRAPSARPAPSPPRPGSPRGCTACRPTR